MNTVGINDNPVISILFILVCIFMIIVGIFQEKDFRIRSLIKNGFIILIAIIFMILINKGVI